MPDSQINPTAAALLGLLHEGPMTGGQLMAAAERRLGPYWSMTRSQVYRELPVLAEMGYVRLGKPGPRSSNQLKTLYTGANEYHSEALAMAREQAKEAKKAGDAYGAAALEFAVAYHKAALSWLKVAPAE